VDYPPFERVVEIVDHPPFVKNFDLHIHFAMSISRKKNSSMEEVFVALRYMQQGNQSLHESITHLQGNQTSLTFGSTSKEPQINLPKKFDGTCSKF
jgi:hypothetical protein